MAFSYFPFATDRDRVRFHFGDVDANAPIFQNEELDAIIEEAGGWKDAVLMCIDSVMARLTATPDFTADWLKVDVSKALAGYRKLRDLKSEQLGLSSGGFTNEAVHVYRKDSQQTEPPTYSET
jgi:hypothetical protein